MELTPNSKLQKIRSNTGPTQHYWVLHRQFNYLNQTFLVDMTQKFRFGGMPPQLQLVGTKSTIIDTPEKLEHLKNVFPFCHPIGCTTETVVTLDCEGAPSDLFFIQVATKEEAFFFDCVTLGATNVCTFLRPLFADKSVVKLMHDLHSCAAALKSVGNVLEFRGMFDTQLAMEVKTGKLQMGFQLMLQTIGIEKVYNVKKYMMKLRGDRYSMKC
jgi:3'-5' exonuclease